MHFTVIVIGDDIKAQLAPYHEFECTGINDEFVQDIDVTDELIERMKKGESLKESLNYYGFDDKNIIFDEAEVNTKGEENPPHMYGYAIVKNGKLIKAVNRTNPNGHWDGYVIGGRWSGFFLLKPGVNAKSNDDRAAFYKDHQNSLGDMPTPVRCDQAIKGDIDFDGMRSQAGDAAARCFDTMREGLIAAGLSPGVTWSSWPEVSRRVKGIDAARQEYDSQPAVKAIRETFKKQYAIISPDQFLCTRERYISRSRDRVMNPVAFVKDGMWLEYEEHVGGFGFSEGKVNPDEWTRKINEMLNSLPDDTLITIVDCHS